MVNKALIAFATLLAILAVVNSDGTADNLDDYSYAAYKEISYNGLLGIYSKNRLFRQIPSSLRLGSKVNIRINYRLNDDAHTKGDLIVTKSTEDLIAYANALDVDLNSAIYFYFIIQKLD